MSPIDLSIAFSVLAMVNMEKYFLIYKHHEHNVEHKSKDKANSGLNDVYLRSLKNKYMKKIIYKYDSPGNSMA